MCDPVDEAVRRAFLAGGGIDCQQLGPDHSRARQLRALDQCPQSASAKLLHDALEASL